MKNKYIQNQIKTSNRATLQSFRFYKEDIEMLNQIATKQNKNKSEVIRDLIKFRYLTLFDKQVKTMSLVVSKIIKLLLIEKEKASEV